MQEKDQLEKHIIESYKKDETMMILVFAQWCVNHDLDPDAVYQKAYPTQESNATLKETMALTVPKEEAGDIPFDTLLNVLSLFGNEDLAWIVTQEHEKLNQDPTSK